MTSLSEKSVDVAEPVSKSWFVYLVRAANGSLYCGISDDPVRRFAKHQSGKGARFFLSSPATARRMANRVACRILNSAISATEAEAMQ